MRSWGPVSTTQRLTVSLPSPRTACHKGSLGCRSNLGASSMPVLPPATSQREAHIKNQTSSHPGHPAA